MRLRMGFETQVFEADRVVICDQERGQEMRHDFEKGCSRRG